jgi:hypothetical protein
MRLRREVFIFRDGCISGMICIIFFCAVKKGKQVKLFTELMMTQKHKKNRDNIAQVLNTIMNEKLRSHYLCLTFIRKQMQQLTQGSFQFGSRSDKINKPMLQ